MPVSRRNRRRPIAHGPTNAAPMDREAKHRVDQYVAYYNRRNKQPRQHVGPITRAFQDVLTTLLWKFHNARNGLCIPSYEAIAARAGCCRDTVCEAIKALEAAGLLSWVRRTRTVGASVVRTSNSYRFHVLGVAKSENPLGTPIQVFDKGKSRPLLPVRTVAQQLAALGAAA
jgi:Helix-turn-helix domain